MAQYVDNGGIASGQDAAVNVSFPATVNEFDILVIKMLDADNDTFTTPDGWYPLASDSASNNCSYASFWKRAKGTESGTVNVTSALSAGSLVCGIMYRFSGCNKYGNPFENIVGTTVSNQTSFNWSASQWPDTLREDSLAVCILAVEDNTITAFTGTGWTENSRLATTTGSDAHFAVATQILADAGVKPSNNTDWDFSAVEYRGATMFHLIPESDITPTLNSPADTADIGDDPTPTVEFTGNDAGSNDVEYEVQIDTVNTFDSGEVTIDSHPVINATADADLSAAGIFAQGQSFTGDGKIIDRATFSLRKSGTPTGNAFAKIYSHSGTYGTSSVPDVLITQSEPFDVSTLTTSFALIDIDFPDPFQTVNGTKYVVVFENLTGNSSNEVEIEYDGTTGHDGNRSHNSGTWSAPGGDVIFYVKQLNPKVREFSNDPIDSSLIGTSSSSISTSGTYLGQSFTGDGKALDVAILKIANSSGSETAGSFKAMLYSHSGTYGTSSVRGSLLATSDTYSYTDLTTTGEPFKFNFPTPYTTVNGTKYVIVVEIVTAYSVGQLYVFFNNADIHSGNKDANGTAQASQDLYFAVKNINDFANTVTAADKDPFNDNEKCDYDVQTTLGYVTHYWKMRAKDPFGINQWSDWSSIRSFDVTEGGGETLVVQDSHHDHSVDNVDLVQDNTLVSNDSSHSHSVDNLDLVQKHTLVSNGSDHNHSAEGNLILVQGWTLSVNESNHNHSVDNLDLTQKNTLSVNESNHNHSVDNVDLIQKHTLVSDESLHSHSVDNLDLIQNWNLTVQESLHSHSVDNLDLIQKNTLISNESSHNHTTENVDLTQKHTLVVQESNHNHSVDNVDLTQKNTLVSNESNHSHSVDGDLVITQKITLVVDEPLHSHTTDNVDLTQKHTLVSEESLHSHTTDNIDLIQKNTLVSDESNHNHLAEGDIDLIQNWNLTVQESLHSHSVDNLDLIQKNTLISEESNHSHSVDNLDLIQNWNLTVQESSHSHSVDNLDLIQKNTLISNDSLHNHLAEGDLNLIEAELLTIQESLHSHSVDNLDLTQKNTLVSNGSTHSHDVDNTDLIQKHLLVINDSVHNHTAENVILAISSFDLVVQDSNHSHTTDNLDLQQNYNLVVQESTHSHGTEGDLDLIQKHTLVVQDTGHNHTTDNPDLVQKHTLVSNDSDHNHLAEGDIILSQGFTLVTQGSDHSHIVNNIDLQQNYTLITEDSIHNHIVDNLDLIQKHSIILQDSLHSHVVDNVDLIQDNILIADSIIHNHLVDNLDLVQSHNILINDSLHNHLVEIVNLIQKNTLALDDSLHNHLVDRVIFIRRLIVQIESDLEASVEQPLLQAKLKKLIKLESSIEQTLIQAKVKA